MWDVSAIIPAYGHAGLTKAAIAALRRQSLPPAEIIVVDDGSPEPFSETGVRVIRHDANRGFAAAVNTGICAAQTPLIAVLNNDVTLAQDWIQVLARTIVSTNVPYACGKIFRPDGRLDGAWDLISRGGLAWRAGAGRPDGQLFSSSRRISFTSFTAVVLQREMTLRLDEAYGTYYEDVEWSLRTALSGAQGIYEPLATSIHLGSATAGARSAFSTRQLLTNHRLLANQYLRPRFEREYRAARILLRTQTLLHGRWPRIGSTAKCEPNDHPALEGLLRESEQEIFRLQTQTYWDRLWRLYFKMVSP